MVAGRPAGGHRGRHGFLSGHLTYSDRPRPAEEGGGVEEGGEVEREVQEDVAGAGGWPIPGDASRWGDGETGGKRYQRVGEGIENEVGK